MKSLLCSVLLYSCMMSSNCVTFWPSLTYLWKWLITLSLDMIKMAGATSAAGPLEYPPPPVLEKRSCVVQFLVFSIVFCRLLFIIFLWFTVFLISFYYFQTFLTVIYNNIYIIYTRLNYVTTTQCIYQTRSHQDSIDHLVISDVKWYD